MSRYIDVIDIAKQIADFKKSITSPNSDYMTGYICALSVTEGMIANAMIASTADVVEVVRCRDCKYFVDEDETDMLGLCTCKRIAIAYNGELYPERDFYCAYGERSENGKS
jgi:hypothetical protein